VLLSSRTHVYQAPPRSKHDAEHKSLSGLANPYPPK
jgi:hypothetical protein